MYVRRTIYKLTSNAKVRKICDVAACPSRKANIDNKERESSDGIKLLVEAPVWYEQLPLPLEALAPPWTGWVTTMVAVARAASTKAAVRRPLRPPQHGAEASNICSE